MVPSEGEWINKWWHIHATEVYSNKNKLAIKPGEDMKETKCKMHIA